MTDKNLQSLNERIAERIGKDLVDLIPADQWQALVDGEVAKFRRETAPSIIQDLLKEAYTSAARESVSVFCQTDEWNDLTQQYTNAALTELLAASGGVIFAGVMSPAMFQVMQSLRSQLGYS